MGTVSGKIKWFNPDKGYGFITRDDGGKDVFLHAKELEKSRYPGYPDNPPQEGDKVSFDAELGKKGDFAVAVSPA